MYENIIMEKRQLRKRSKRCAVQNDIKTLKKDEVDRTGLLDLPNEMIEDEIFPYLNLNDIDTISRVGSSRLRSLAKGNIEGNYLSLQ